MILAAGHGCGAVIQNHKGDVGSVMDHVQQRSHAVMIESGITDDTDNFLSGLQLIEFSRSGFRSLLLHSLTFPVPK